MINEVVDNKIYQLAYKMNEELLTYINHSDLDSFLSIKPDDVKKSRYIDKKAHKRIKDIIANKK